MAPCDAEAFSLKLRVITLASLVSVFGLGLSNDTSIPGSPDCRCSVWDFSAAIIARPITLINSPSFTHTPFPIDFVSLENPNTVSNFILNKNSGDAAESRGKRKGI